MDLRKVEMEGNQGGFQMPWGPPAPAPLPAGHPAPVVTLTSSGKEAFLEVSHSPGSPSSMAGRMPEGNQPHRRA